jgi:23S rRNA (adenine2030-N6)-methyltransferase
MRLAQGLRDAARRFATGTALMWFPIKEQRAVSIFRREITELGLDKLLLVELSVGETGNMTGLTDTGLVVLNPPFTLEDKLSLLLPFLSNRLAQGKGAGGRLEWLSRPRVTTP